jgi:iron complex transport system substrate-binding protein
MISREIYGSVQGTKKADGLLGKGAKIHVITQKIDGKGRKTVLFPILAKGFKSRQIRVNIGNEEYSHLKKNIYHKSPFINRAIPEKPFVLIPMRLSDYSIRMKTRANTLSALLLTSALFTSLALASCTPGQNKNESRSDRKKPARIASMAPSSTVILAQLGLADKIVACDTWSGSVAGVPETAIRFDMMKPDAEKLASLEPDLLLVSTITQAGTSVDPFKPLSDSGVRVVYIPTSESLEGIGNDVTAIAALVGEEAAGKKIADAMKDEVSKLKKIAEGIPAADRKTAYFEISPAPWMYGFGTGVYLDDALAAAGFTNILADQKGWVSVSAETVVAKNPDVIFTNIEAGSGDSATGNAVAEIKTRKGWENVAAIQNGKVYAIDTRTSAQPTPDIVKAIRQMAEAVYPEYYK